MHQLPSFVDFVMIQLGPLRPVCNRTFDGHPQDPSNDPTLDHWSSGGWPYLTALFYAIQLRSYRRQRAGDLAKRASAPSKLVVNETQYVHNETHQLF